MQIVFHRRNHLSELLETPIQYGVEVDIRSQGDQLIIHHDPFMEGESFEAWLEAYRHSLLILNVKEEGLEKRLLDLMTKRGIQDFFFLDQSFPFLLKTVYAGEPRCAVRVSEFESIETALSLQGKVSWVWVDCFTKFPLSKKQVDQLKEAGFKLCLVSGELQGRDPKQDIPLMNTFLKENQIKIDAVCTKFPELWQ